MYQELRQLLNELATQQQQQKIQVALLNARGMHLRLYNGSSNVISYDLVIKRGGEEVFHNKTDGARTENSIPTSAFDKSNEDLTVYVKAVSALGPGPESSNTFKSPGPCMKPSLSEGRKNQTFVTVNWTTPDCNNLPVNTFRVNATFLNGTSVFFRDVNSQITSLLIGPLNPDTKYKVYVTFINCASLSTCVHCKITEVDSACNWTTTSMY